MIRLLYNGIKFNHFVSNTLVKFIKKIKNNYNNILIIIENQLNF